MTDTYKYIERFCHGENVLDLLREAEKRIDSLEMELAVYKASQPKDKKSKTNDELTIG